MAGLPALKVFLLGAGLIGIAYCKVNDTTAELEKTPSTQASGHLSGPSLPRTTLPPSTINHNVTSAITSTITNLPTKVTPTSSDRVLTTVTPLRDISNSPSTSTSASTANTSHGQRAPPASNQTIQNQTVNTETTTTTTGTPTPNLPTPCTYTVEKVKFGFQFKFEKVRPGSYSIKLNHSKTETIIYINDTITHEIQFLKPLTFYNHTVQLINSNGLNTTCRLENGSQPLQTLDIKRDEIEAVKCSNYICYSTNWTIDSTQSHRIQSCKNGSYDFTYCIKPSYKDICTNLTTTFGSKPQFNLTNPVGLEFLNTNDIKLEVADKLPTNILWKNIPKCGDLAINYTCEDESGTKLKPINLTMLEPYKKYDCTGEILSKGEKINKTITQEVRIECDVPLTITSVKSKNTSIEFSWQKSSVKCPDVIPTYGGLSYTCDCGRDGTSLPQTSESAKCEVHGLKPYETYSCDIGVHVEHYYRHRINHTTLSVETEAGVPSIRDVSVKMTDNNAFSVKCVLQRWNGPVGSYFAELSGGVQVLKIEKPVCSFEFDGLSYSTQYHLSVFAFNKLYNSSRNSKPVRTHYNNKALIGFLGFLIVLMSVALVFIIFKIYNLHLKKPRRRESIALITSMKEEGQLMNVEPIGAEFLLDVYKKKSADEGRLFLDEFQSIPRVFTRIPMREAKKPHNKIKNRYMDILPYDFNRVQLTTGNGETGCDYINASFINGFQEAKKYIAAQGPKDETMADFWRMIWEQQSSIIVMVAQCVEGKQVKCAQYWPSAEGEADIFDEFIVKLNKEERCPDYIIRRLTITSKREKNSERGVTHIQFISWPDHGVPEEPQLLLKLRKRVNAFKNLFSGPIVVHCSAGVGRTGTYIGIDAMMEGLESEGRVDIYGYVARLRKQRCLMVQVETQYILIHQAMKEHKQFGDTEICLSEFQSTLSMLKQRDADSEPSLLEEEFQRVPMYKNWRPFNTGLTEENKKKNRFPTIIPYDFNRVLVKVDNEKEKVKVEDQNSHNNSREDEDESSDDDDDDDDDEGSANYINASHVDGYWGPYTLITAQHPLPHTRGEFWQMVYQEKAKAIVMLSECNPGGTESCSPYWDKEKEAFGDLEVEVSQTDTNVAFTTRTMHIHHTQRKEHQLVKHFHFLRWPNHQLPEKSLELTDMMRSVKQACGHSNVSPETRAPLVVHCSDGSAHSGLFCALWNLMECAETEKMVDVFQVVKALRKQRQGMIASQEQYQFLYEAVGAAFPVQNGDVKEVPPPYADSVQMVNETTDTKELVEVKLAEQPTAITSSEQQEAADAAAMTIPLVLNLLDTS